jgi:hypothetical protein
MIPFLFLSTAQQPMGNEHDERQHQQHNKTTTHLPSGASLHDKPSFHDFIHDTFHDLFSNHPGFFFGFLCFSSSNMLGSFIFVSFFGCTLSPPFFGVVLLFYCSRFWIGEGKGGMGCSIIHYLVRGIVVGWAQELFFIFFPFGSE